MWKNYLRIAFRNLWKHKGFSFINLMGLAVAFTCCLLMFMYIRHELSFDRFQEKGNRIVRVIMEYGFGDTERRAGNFTSTKVMPAFKRNFPEVEEGVRMFTGNGLIKVGDQIYEDPWFLYADSTFFNVFSSFELIAGTPDKVLEHPNQVVIAASAARKYFGDQNPVGQTIFVGASGVPYQVTGVAEDCPSNSQIRFSLLASFSSLGPAQEETYWNANYQTYLLLKEGTSVEQLQAKIRPFIEKDLNDPNIWLSYILEPYFDVHLHSPYSAYVANTDIRYIYIASGMAVLILLIACFTYVNMSTARSLERAREVGIRKVSGASRKQVFVQFLGESVLIAFLALILSIGLTMFFLPGFNGLINRELSMKEFLHPAILGSAIAMVLVIALLAGSYPALVLSGYQPIRVLKGSFRNTGSGHQLRQSLTVFQFVISAFLLIGSLVIFKQVRYIQSKSLGFTRDHVLLLPADNRIVKKMDLLKTRFKTNPQVKHVSLGYEAPYSIGGGYNMRSSTMSEQTALATIGNPIDEDYLKVNEIEIIAGSDLNRQDILDAERPEEEAPYYRFIINETAARQLGWTAEEAIGKRMFLGEGRPGEVKAVVKDFHFSTLHSPIEALVMFPSSWGNTIMVKMSGQEIPATLAHLESVWKEVAPHRPFSYSFMDESYDAMYHAEQRTARIIGLFTGLAIFLACVGLLGLSAYAVQQRTKEIGVRKVLGASVGGIVWMLTVQFLRLVAIAFVIALPLGWYAAKKWLEDFSYRTSVNLDIFFQSALGLTLFALIAISIQTIRAANLNPVRSLRSE